MTIQICVPHYKESAEIIKPLLDSIAIQQNVPFDEIGVIICHDGKDVKDFCFTDSINLCGDFTLPDSYPFNIEQIRIPHKGVSACRNACLDYATADYVMFCDADDMFCNVCGMYILFREMEIGFDSLVSMFIEETRDPENKEPMYVNHEMDSTFVHGKVHRRQYLIDNKIRWNDSLTIHEDSYFNILCQNLSENVKYCPTPFYLWKWRDESVCRHDPKYILKTYQNMIDSNDALVDEFSVRGAKDKAAFYTAYMILDAYYNMNKPEWINQENKEYRDSTEARFALYYEKHKSIWDSVSVPDRMVISNSVRGRSINEGMVMESMTLDDWLKNVEDKKV